uniref:Uncharacterized protein n=1 Tax=Rhodnius prolixus TaxID=13249 RepID=T1HU10_RHOPR
MELLVFSLVGLTGRNKCYGYNVSYININEEEFVVEQAEFRVEACGVSISVQLHYSAMYGLTKKPQKKRLRSGPKNVPPLLPVMGFPQTDANRRQEMAELEELLAHRFHIIRR